MSRAAPSNTPSSELITRRSQVRILPPRSTEGARVCGALRRVSAWLCASRPGSRRRSVSSLAPGRARRCLGCWARSERDRSRSTLCGVADEIIEQRMRDGDVWLSYERRDAQDVLLHNPTPMSQELLATFPPLSSTDQPLRGQRLDAAGSTSPDKSTLRCVCVSRMPGRWGRDSSSSSVVSCLSTTGQRDRRLRV